MDNAVRRAHLPMLRITGQILVSMDNGIGYCLRYCGLDIRQFFQCGIQMGNESRHRHSGKAFITGDRIKYDFHLIPAALRSLLQKFFFFRHLNVFPLCYHVLLISAPIIALFFIIF